jgi:hypothetical protein
MNAKSAPRLTPEDLARERPVASVESAIGGTQERLSNLAADGQDAKWSVSDPVRLLRPTRLAERNHSDDEQPEPRNHKK